MGVGKQNLGRTVRQNGANAPLWIGRVNRHICPTRFENGQQADHHFHRTFQRNCHQRIGPNAKLDEMVGELIGTLIEFRIGELPVFKQNRHRIGGCCRLRLKQRMNRLRFTVIHRRVVPLVYNLMAFSVGEQRQVRDTLFRLGNKSDEQLLPLCQQPLNRLNFINGRFTTQHQRGCFSNARRRNERIPRITRVYPLRL